MSALVLSYNTHRCHPASSDQPTLVVTHPIWEHFIKAHNWSELAEALIAKSIDVQPAEQRMFGEYIWRLFNAWHSLWKKGAIFQEQRPQFRKLFLDCHAFLSQIITPVRSSMLLELIKYGFKEPGQLNLISKHNQAGLQLLDANAVKEFLQLKIKSCLNIRLLHILYTMLPTETVARLQCILKGRDYPPLEQLSGIIDFYKKLNPKDFDDLQLTIINQLIIERRYKELDQYGFTIDFSEMFQQAFQESLNQSQYEWAETVLNDWKEYCGLSSVTHEAQLLRLRIQKGYRDDESVNAIIALWNSTPRNPQPILDAVYPLCVEIATSPIAINPKAINAIWSVIQDRELGSFCSGLKFEGLTNLLQKLRHNKAYTAIWEILHKWLKRKNPWDTKFEQFVEAVLNASLSKKSPCKTMRDKCFPLILKKMHPIVKWHQKSRLDRNNGLTVLVIRNLTAMAATPMQGYDPRNSGNVILRDLRAQWFLTSTDRETISHLQSKLDAGDSTPIKIQQQIRKISKFNQMCDFYANHVDFKLTVLLVFFCIAYFAIRTVQYNSEIDPTPLTIVSTDSLDSALLNQAGSMAQDFLLVMDAEGVNIDVNLAEGGRYEISVNRERYNNR